MFHLICVISEERSPPVSMKSKATGLNFMVSVGRAIEAGGDNALAKLLQASQDLVSHARRISYSETL